MAPDETRYGEIAREMNATGDYVVPRIKDLREIEEFLSEQVPEITYVIAHGQMAAGELDSRMNAFYEIGFPNCGCIRHAELRKNMSSNSH